MILPLLLVACDAPEARRARRGNPLTDDGEPLLHDTADTAADTGLGDSGDTADSAPPDTAIVDEACYLGPDRDHSVCFSVVTVSEPGADYAYPAPYDGSAQYTAPARYLDLQTIEASDAVMDVAPNFVLSEFAAAYKGRWGVVQTHLVDFVQEVRDVVGGPVTVNSGYRSPAYNAGVGGVEYSRHQYGDGVDLEAGGYSVEALGDLCYDAGADYVGLYEDGHTHCDWRDHALDRAFFDPAPARPPARRAPPVATVECALGRCTATAPDFDEGEPFHRWTVWGADGAVIAKSTARTLEMPEGAARIGVVVGGVGRGEWP